MQTLTIIWHFSSNASDGDSICICASILSFSLCPITFSTANNSECHVRGWEPVPAALCDHRARSSNAHPSTLCSLCLIVSKIACSTPKACPTSSHFAAMVGTIMSLRMSNSDGLASTNTSGRQAQQCVAYYQHSSRSVCCHLSGPQKEKTIIQSIIDNLLTTSYDNNVTTKHTIMKWGDTLHSNLLEMHLLERVVYVTYTHFVLVYTGVSGDGIGSHSTTYTMLLVGISLPIEAVRCSPDMWGSSSGRGHVLSTCLLPLSLPHNGMRQEYIALLYLSTARHTCTNRQTLSRRKSTEKGMKKFIT